MTDKKAPPSATISQQIPFHDCDPAQIVWHGNYAKYFEIARCKLLDTIDYNYPQMRDSGYFWPVIDMKARFVRALSFQQNIEVTAILKEWENRLVIDYLIRDADTGARMTKGQTTQVAVEIDSGELQLCSPPILAEKLGVSDAASA